jgi:hypothetical protein
LLAAAAPLACVSPAHQGVGLLRTSVRGPLFASDDPAPAHIVSGESSTRTFLGLFSHGDASLAAAMRAGGVASVHHADFEQESLLFGLLATYRTIVYGAPVETGADVDAEAPAGAVARSDAPSILARETP